MIRGEGDWKADRLEEENKRLREVLTEYADHISWRCSYRTRYGKCVCGLDEKMAEFGMPPVLVHDPEASENKRI